MSAGRDGEIFRPCFFLTESGKKLQKLVEQGFSKIEKEVWDGISDIERDAFMKTFLKINENLSKQEI